MSMLRAPESSAPESRGSANLAPPDGTDPPRTGRFKGRASRWTAGIALGVVWVGLGWWLGLDVVGFILLAVGLIMIFQVAVRRRPLRQLWARDSTTFARHVSGKLGVAAVLVLTVALMVAEAVVQGTYVDTGWTALVMAVVLVVVYAVGRRLLVALTVGALVVVAATVIMAPRLAADRAGDAELTAELEGLQSSGYLDGMQDLVVVTIDSSASEPTRQATVGTLSGTTPMEVGSFTKALTGLMVADSVQRGELAMNAPVSTYLPELEGTAAGTATIHDLVTHRAGYPEFDTASFRRAAWRAPIGDNFLAGEVDTVLAAAATAELDAPGTYKYSTLGAAVAGQAAARAAGLAYPDLMRTRLFEPLGMAHTAVQTETALVAGGRSAAGLPAQPWIMKGYAPGGGVVSTADDLTILVTAILNGTAPGLDALIPNEPGNASNTRVGAFWQISQWQNGQTISWHNGQTAGYATYVGVDRDHRRATIVLSDIGRPEVTDLGITLLASTR